MKKKILYKKAKKKKGNKTWIFLYDNRKKSIIQNDQDVIKTDKISSKKNGKNTQENFF